MKGYRINLVGQRFDKLLVIELVEKTKSGSLWLCRCDCGSEVIKMTTQLRRLSAISKTGCRSCEPLSRSDSKVTHGGCRFGKAALYSTWKSMRNRCRDKSDLYYGAKGVTVCEEWENYSTFRDWAMANGYEDVKGVTRGDRLSIDRIDPSRGYGPGNCRWVTVRENSRMMANAKLKLVGA